MDTIDGSALGDKEVDESEVWESKVYEINMEGLDECQDSERDKVVKEATNAENLWVDSKDTVKNGHLEDSLELAGNLDARREIEKLEEGGTASNVTRAIVVVLDWNSSLDTSTTAVSFLESVKAGDHLVRLSWDELNPTERRDFANVVVNSMYEIANPCGEWALKSQTAALIAEIVKREGLSTWQELLPSLISLSNSGPIQTELVSMMIRWLPEDIIVHNEDLEGDRRRLLLCGLNESLPKILPMWYILLERHFGATLSEAGRKQMDIAKQHATTVTTTLNGANTYVEWAPIPDLSKYGIIHGCSILLSSPESCLHAHEFFNSVSSRKQPVDVTSKFDSAVGESLVSLGSLNLQCISGDSAILLFYLQQMLGYF